MNLEIEAYEGELRELRKAAKMALKTLENERLKKDEHLLAVVEEALRQALAQPEQEPVGYVTIENISSWAQVPSIKWFKKPTEGPLYTAPPKREWVGLTDEEIESCNRTTTDWGEPCVWLWDDDFEEGGLQFAKAIEAKLKEKNT